MVSNLQMNTIIEIYKAAIKTGPDYLRLNLWFESGEPHFLFTDAPRQGLQKKKTKQKATQKITQSQVANMVKPTGETSSSPAVTRAAKRKATELSPNESSANVTEKTPETVRAPAVHIQAKLCDSPSDQDVDHHQKVVVPSIPTANRFSQLAEILSDDEEIEDTSSNSSRVAPSHFGSNGDPDKEDCSCDAWCSEFLSEINEPGFSSGCSTCCCQCSCLKLYPTKEERTRPNSEHSCALCLNYLKLKKKKNRSYSDVAKLPART